MEAFIFMWNSRKLSLKHNSLSALRINNIDNMKALSKYETTTYQHVISTSGEINTIFYFIAYIIFILFRIQLF